MAGYNGNYGGALITVDVTEAVSTMNKLATIMSPDKAHELFRRTLVEAGKKVRPVAKDVFPNDYVMKSGWIGAAVKGMEINGTDQVKVPIKTDRGTIGGTFPATGGAYKVQGTTVHMKDGTTRQRKAHIRTRAIKAKIVKSGISVLPDRMPSWQGGQPPFMMGGTVMTRSGPSRFPIHRVVGLAVPQPPIDRSQAKFEEKIQTYMMQRLEHNFWQLFR